MIDPMSSDELLAPTARYQGDSGRSYHDGRHRATGRAFDLIAAARARKFGPYVNATDVVVELGVGPGWNLAALDCRERIGVDLATSLAATVESLGIRFVEASADLPDEVADVVISHHMLEHVSHPIDVLREMRRILRTGGTLLLHVPYEVQRRYRTFERDEPNHHLYAWNAQTLGALVEDAGMRVTSSTVGRFGYERVTAEWTRRLGGGARMHRILFEAAQTVRPIREVQLRATRV